MPIGANIKELRIKKAMTQKELAQKIGMKITYMSRLENDNGDPKLSTIIKVMEALECTPNELFINEESSTSAQLLNEMEKVNQLNDGLKKELVSIIRKYVLFNDMAQNVKEMMQFMGAASDGEKEALVEIMENTGIDLQKLVKNKL